MARIGVRLIAMKIQTFREGEWVFRRIAARTCALRPTPRSWQRIGHADRSSRSDYCVGLLTAEGRKSVEPLAALTA